MAVTQIPKWTLGDRLRKARLSAGIRSHKEMASRLGISEDTVKRWEADKHHVNRVAILGWAMECNVDPNWLEGIQGGDAATEPVTLHEPSDWRQLTIFGIENCAAA